jgi:HEAT repeat protein
MPRCGPELPLRRAHFRDLQDAKARGPFAKVYEAARAYLATLGFPGPIQTAQERCVGWHGARFSYVMRDLARAAEVLGRFDEAAAPALAEGALRRLRRVGPEAWEWRVRGIEGLADVAQRQAFEPLLSLISVGAPEVRRRALSALGTLAERPCDDPCKPGHGQCGSGANWYRRPIPALGRSCATKLTDPEAAVLARRIAVTANDPQWRGRRQTAKTLGAIGSPVALPVLQQLLKDSERTAWTCKDRIYYGDAHSGKGCKPRFDVRIAAREAIHRIETRDLPFSRRF